jgi:hypothetical protein
VIDFDAKVLAPCMAVFGESQTPLYRRAAGGAAFEIDGVFDDAYTATIVVADGDPEVATFNPVLGVRLAQFSGTDPVQGDKVAIPRIGKTYVVSDVHPDSHGHATLILLETQPWT